MKICVAQTRPVKGDIEQNIQHHKKFVELAASRGARMIIFPELSITGYEPALAKELAMNIKDTRLNIFQQLSDEKQLTIGIGAPVKASNGLRIGMIIFQPQQQRQAYFKKYLHADEVPFFSNGENSITSIDGVSLAICYELSVTQHAEDAHKAGGNIYLASVAKTAQGVEKAAERLSEIAKNYSMTVLMSNCIGENDGVQCAGRSSVWNEQGVLLAQLNDTDEGMIIMDTETAETQSTN